MTSSTRREAPFWTPPILEAVGYNTGVYVLALVVMRHYMTGVMAAGVSGHYGDCAGYRVLRVVGGSAPAP